ncbi:hypothetical protein [Paenibacillus medicaginis]|uniref:AP2 domain-containing protein n=1 Tax=Paenibacillus medicaginis TaxID=1470560 RepID=A0ABV5BUT9_9BACL
MKWIQGKMSRWDTFDTWKARYKNFHIKVSEGSNGFSKNVEYYWFSITNEKTDTRQNSLWFDGKYSTLQEAQSEAVKWIDDYLKGK